MISLFGLMGAFFVLLAGASYFFYRRNSPVQYGISLSSMLISIFLYSIFGVGGFEGMGLGALAAALFLASVLSLFVSVLFNIINRHGKGAV
ncbi:YesK family protein [Priestia megaterium]|uniref:YesK family protein n=2 Tax=Priestia megaterium TaxID=1404 RepID=UPI002E1EA60E|nr:YesK family protein [Priestia megaterium]MED4756557.1 YesK family protein [Priestia megaterium]